MTAPFVTQLRSGKDVLVLGADGAPRITIRVEVPEVWDTIRVSLTPETPVSELKRRSLAVLMSDEPYPEQFVVKLGGFEVLDENESVTEAGAVDGSIFLLTSRRRRPVRG